MSHDTTSQSSHLPFLLSSRGRAGGGRWGELSPWVKAVLSQRPGGQTNRQWGLTQIRGSDIVNKRGCVTGQHRAVVGLQMTRMHVRQLQGLFQQTSKKKKKNSTTAQLLMHTVTDSPDSSYCMTKARQDQLGPQVLYALEQPCPSGMQPSRGQLLEQEPCHSECVSPLLVLAAYLRRLLQHTLKGQAVRSLPCTQEI